MYDTVKERVFLFLQVNGSVSVLLSSDDKGATWTKGQKIDIDLGRFKSVVPGVGVGIQIQGALCADTECGGKASRLVLPFICTDSSFVERVQGIACPGCHSCVLVSDDHGATWALAASSSQDGSRESSLVQLHSVSDARIYASERNMGNNTGHRLHAVPFFYFVDFEVFRWEGKRGKMVRFI